MRRTYKIDARPLVIISGRAYTYGMTLKRWLQRTLNRLRGVPLVLACLTFVACASPPATFTAQPGLEDATRAAVEAWEQALPCDIHVEYVTSDAEVTVEWRALEDTAPGVHKLGEGGITGDEFGPWGTFDSYVYVDPETTSDKLYAVVAHELGHALRAPHTTNERDLMFAKYTPAMSSKPTARDGKAVCDAWGM